MKTRAGIWVDHENAIIVFLIDGRESCSRVEADAEGHFRFSGGRRTSPTYGHQDISPERRIEERYRQHLHKYYRKVIHAVRGADEIFIFGPGEAKFELKKEFKKSRELSARIVGIERADKMTESEIVAKARDFYEEA